MLNVNIRVYVFPQHFVAIINTCTECKFCYVNVFLSYEIYNKNTYRRMVGKIFTRFDRCLYCKIYLSRPKEQFHKRGPESSGAPSIIREDGFSNSSLIYLPVLTFEVSRNSSRIIVVLRYHYQYH